MTIRKQTFQTNATSIRFTATDRELIERVKKWYGTNSTKDTVIYALRVAEMSAVNSGLRESVIKEARCSSQSAS